jgi:Zn ribbon nucleic-acid-binding protein
MKNQICEKCSKIAQWHREDIDAHYCVDCLRKGFKEIAKLGFTVVKDRKNVT